MFFDENSFYEWFVKYSRIYHTFYFYAVITRVLDLFYQINFQIKLYEEYGYKQWSYKFICVDVFDIWSSFELTCMVMLLPMFFVKIFQRRNIWSSCYGFSFIVRCLYIIQCDNNSANTVQFCELPFCLQKMCFISVIYYRRVFILFTN